MIARTTDSWEAGQSASRTSPWTAVTSLAVALAVIAMTGCSGGTAKKSPKVRFGYLPMVSSLTYFVALDQDFFVEEGVEVKGIPIQTSNAIASSLDAGDIDIGVELAVIPLLNQLKMEKGRSSFLIFSTSVITAENGFDSIIVLEKSAIKSLGDLTGRKVAVFPGTTAANTLLEVFKKKFPDLPPPKAIPMSPSLHLNVLTNEEVDAVHAYEPFLSIGLSQRRMRRIQTSLYAEQVSPNPIGVAAVNRRWYESSSTTANKAIAAIDRAAKFIESYPDKARMIMAKYTETDSEVAKVMNVMPMSSSKNLDRDNLRQYMSQLKQMGEISLVPDVETICHPAK